MNEESEIELVQLLRNPSTRRNAFERMVQLYSERLYWQIRKLVLLHEDADDLLQNTFVKAWTNLDRFRGESKLSTWLYRIAINESLTFLAKKRKKMVTSIEEGDGYLLDQLKGDVYFDGDKVNLKLQEALLTLPEKQRLVFTLRYQDEMKYEEMSEVLETSVGALKTSYHIAAKKIKLFLKEND